MPTIEHHLLTGAFIHEPKGADTADDGKFYVADGLGSGTWTYSPTGWGYYKDDASAQVVSTSAVKLSIDGAGGTSESSYLPKDIRGTSELWDTTTDDITPVAVGDAYDIRLDLPVTAKSGAPALVTLQLDIGATEAASTVIVERDITTSKTPPYVISVGFPIFCGSTFLANGGQFFLHTDTGTVDITKPAIAIVRNHGEI